MKSTDLAYIAGFFDGEGCISEGSHGKRPSGLKRMRLEVSASQNVKKPLLFIKKHFGGSIRLTASGCYEWRLRDRKAKEFLVAILPYLKVKQALAADTISFS